TSEISRENGAGPVDHRTPAPFAGDTLSLSCAGGGRHEPAPSVSAPAGIRGGDVVSGETPSGLNDAPLVPRYCFCLFGARELLRELTTVGADPPTRARR